MPALWLTGDHFVGKASYRSTNQANSAFHPSGVGKWVVIHVTTWITGWTPLNGSPGLHMAVWSQVEICVHGLRIWPIGCTLALSVTQKRRRCCGMWFKCSMPLFLPFCGWQNSHFVTARYTTFIRDRLYSNAKLVLCFNRTAPLSYSANVGARYICAPIYGKV